ncbi:SURF1 family protein [Candidimonas nitroreducens]|uniref:SURF1-like protein n=1 Tax=Candidimonas nitroreducens TaxID=683354 RepID=A0A225MAC4_9BURK|nr:Surfeit locus 1 family protein [Candidimonas nitroreducens]
MAPTGPAGVPGQAPALYPAVPERAVCPRRGAAGLIGLALLGLLLFSLFFGLGTWQVQRRAWKLDLIARVDRRVHAAPVPAPGPADWARVSAGADEYRRVTLQGSWIAGKNTLVKAVTKFGGGFWVLTPLRRADGSIVLVNRGFVPEGRRKAALPPPAAGAVSGLLRITEPGGAFLHKNDPAAGRWYSRDVAAIAAARGLPAARVAPYFVDAEAAPSAVAGAPVGGLTVIHFYNNHLVYAITWYTLALMVVAAGCYVVRDERRRRRHPQGDFEGGEERGLPGDSAAGRLPGPGRRLEGDPRKE